MNSAIFTLYVCKERADVELGTKAMGSNAKRVSAVSRLDGSGLLYMYKRDRGDRRKFLNEPLKGTKIKLCGCGANTFSPLRSTNSNDKSVPVILP